MLNIRLASLVYVSTYCVLIALLCQNKPFRLLYLGHAQMKIMFVITYVKGSTGKTEDRSF